MSKFPISISLIVFNLASASLSSYRDLKGVSLYDLQANEFSKCWDLLLLLSTLLFKKGN